jgi:hypothetical protein
MNLDGLDYNVTVTWNVSAQRYYINVYDQNGEWIITVPLVSSPPARSVKKVVYDPFLNLVIVQMTDPTSWPVPLSSAGLATPPGTIIDYTLLGFNPNTYNGKFRCLHLDSSTFTFPISTNPGPVTFLGTISRMLNMIEPLFITSSLVYRNSSFEINP